MLIMKITQLVKHQSKKEILRYEMKAEFKLK